MGAPTKDRVLELLRAGPMTKAAAVAQFDGLDQQRGVAGFLAYLLRSDQAELDDQGRYVLTGRKAKPAQVPHNRKPRAPMSLSTAGFVAPEPEPEPEPATPELQWALRHDGDLLIRRGDASIVLSGLERTQMIEWLAKVAA